VERARLKGNVITLC